jgi:hypothetical protein
MGRPETSIVCAVMEPGFGVTSGAGHGVDKTQVPRLARDDKSKLHLNFKTPISFGTGAFY